MRRIHRRSRLSGLLPLAAAFLAGVPTPAALAAGVTGAHPGYPGAWEHLSTGTLIELRLDAPVALSDGRPDLEPCVRKLAMEGLRLVAEEVPCSVSASGDRMTVRLYPAAPLDADTVYAYEIRDLRFESGEVLASFTGAFRTGEDAAPTPAVQVDESAMCDDAAGGLAPSSPPSSWCVRCHTEWRDEVPCTITP